MKTWCVRSIVAGAGCAFLIQSAILLSFLVCHLSALGDCIDDLFWQKHLPFATQLLFDAFPFYWIVPFGFLVLLVLARRICRSSDSRLVRHCALLAVAVLCMASIFMQIAVAEGLLQALTSLPASQP